MRIPGGGFRGSGSPFSRGSGLQFGSGLPMSPVVKNLLIANIALFALELLPGVDASEIGHNFGLVPADVFAGGRVWQLFTYMFLHGSFGHIFFNMLILWMFGTTVEHQWGSRPFLWYYLVCGVGGALTTWVSGPSSQVHTIGASAAVLGVLLAYALMYPDRKVFIYFLFPIKMKYLVWGLAAVDLFAAFDGRKDGFAHFAHLGGMLVGWLYLKQDWRVGSFGRKFRAQSARRKMESNTKRTEQEQLQRDELTRETNRILEKINRDGLDSLTPEELRVLREASRR
jgi:membrane associated rhomboid family serine protease